MIILAVAIGLVWPLQPAEAVLRPVGAPVKLLIPKIGVNAQIRRTGITKNYVLQPPPSPTVVGWFKESAVPGFRGNAVMAGHLDWYNGPAVFAKLGRLRRGDIVTVINDFNKKISYRVREVRTYRSNQVPINKIVGPSRGFHLNLYTCAGVFHRWGGYSHRIVVYTDQIPRK